MKKKAPRRCCGGICRSSLETPRPPLSKRESTQTTGAWRNPYTLPRSYYWLRIAEWIALLGLASIGLVALLSRVLA